MVGIVALRCRRGHPLGRVRSGRVPVGRCRDRAVADLLGWATRRSALPRWRALRWRALRGRALPGGRALWWRALRGRALRGRALPGGWALRRRALPGGCALPLLPRHRMLGLAEFPRARRRGTGLPQSRRRLLTWARLLTWRRLLSLRRVGRPLLRARVADWWRTLPWTLLRLGLRSLSLWLSLPRRGVARPLTRARLARRRCILPGLPRRLPSGCPLTWLCRGRCPLPAPALRRRSALPASGCRLRTLPTLRLGRLGRRGCSRCVSAGWLPTCCVRARGLRARRRCFGGTRCGPGGSDGSGCRRVPAAARHRRGDLLGTVPVRRHLLGVFRGRMGARRAGGVLSRIGGIHDCSRRSTDASAALISPGLFTTAQPRAG